MSTWFTDEFKQMLRERVPDSLDDLRGPADGIVELPFRLTGGIGGRFDLSKPKARFSLYHALIVECDEGDPEAYINKAHLIELWPSLRRIVSEGYSSPWEEKFPELQERVNVETST